MTDFDSLYRQIDDRVGIDSQCVTYLIEALSGIYDPVSDPDEKLRSEKIALAWISQYTTLEITSTVISELMGIKEFTKRIQHEHFQCFYLIENVDFLWQQNEERVNELLKYHNKLKDCRILAEAETAGCAYLILNDKDFIKRLSNYTPIKLMKPSDYWKISSFWQFTPRWFPIETNPLAGLSWYTNYR